MRKLMLASACALFLGTAGVAVAAELIEGTLTVAAGATNSAAEITLNRSGSLEAPAVDRLVVLNASGTGTGTVTFAAMAAGVSVTICSTNSVCPGSSAALWPRREYVVGGATNTEPYTAHKVRVSVIQGAVSEDTVYNFGAIPR